MAESNTPSYFSSTLSQLAVGAFLVYSTAALLVAAGVIFVKLPVETAKQVMEWPTVLLTMFASSYLTARKMNGQPSPEEHKP